MEIKEITDQNFAPTWNRFVGENSSPASFLQSWQWGEFHAKKLNEKILRLAIYNSTQINADEADERGLIAVALLIKKTLPFNRWYWECSRGPVIKFPISNPESSSGQVFQFPNKDQISNFKFQQKILELLIQEIKKITLAEKIIFVRFELPVNCHPDENRDPRFREDDKKKDGKLQTPRILTHSKNPENTLVIDLSKSENEILQAMHQKTRYNIRLAEKKGVKIVGTGRDLSKNNIDKFYKLLEETAKRDKIKIFNKKYYENLITYFSLPLIPHSSLLITVFFAEYQNKILSAIMVIGFGNTATYLHGGSSNENREVMPNHAIQWAAIKWAKNQGYLWYDFWGVLSQQAVSSKQHTENWHGIDRFKRGFVSNSTGQEINYPGAKDFVLNKKWYNLFRLGKVLKF